MPLMGEVFSLLCAVVWALAIVFFRVAGSSVPALELNLIKNTLATFMLVVTWFFLWASYPSIHNFAFSSKEVLYLCLSGMIGITLADTLLLQSLQLIGASRYSVISCLFSPFVIGLAIVFLGERFSGIQFLGFAIVVMGTLIVTSRNPQNDLTPEAFRNGSILGILSVLFIAIGMTITKPIVNDASAIATAGIRMIAGTLGSALWILLSGRFRKSVAIFSGYLPWKAIGISSFLGSYLSLVLWIIGFQKTNASVASVLNQTSVLFTLVFAAWILKERIGFRKILGATLGFLGVLVIFLAA